MEKRYAFFLALLITLVIAGNYLFFYDFSSNREIVVISRVIDGDTVELEDGRKIRLVNINTPEKGDVGYEEAKVFLQEFENKTVELEIEGVEKYGRILGKLYFEERYVNLELVEMGFAHTYIVEEDELSEFKKGEVDARESGLEIWERSEHYDCLSAEIHKKEEFVIIVSDCGSDFEGWTLKDESTRIYRFSKIGVNNFTLYSGVGESTESEYYWGRSGGKAWNNDKDSIFIRDENGKLVYYDSYGY